MRSKLSAGFDFGGQIDVIAFGYLVGLLAPEAPALHVALFVLLALGAVLFVRLAVDTPDGTRAVGFLLAIIRAQTGWESNTNKSEWRHFQWKPDKQETFGDELELVGYSEKDLKAAGYTEADLDRKPG